jgi:hypothetical protein
MAILQRPAKRPNGEIAFDGTQLANRKYLAVLIGDNYKSPNLLIGLKNHLTRLG